MPDSDPTPPGLIHSYQRYDPKSFPSPTAPPPDIAGAAFEHMLAFGDLRELTEEELARAIRLDPGMFPQLGPSLESLAAMLRERKRRILATYETHSVRSAAAREFDRTAREAAPPKAFRDSYIKAVREEQIADLENIWNRQADERAPFSIQLLHVLERLSDKYQIDEMAGRYEFTGREALTVEEALAVKQELETIDELLEQLKQAAKDARIGIIDMDALSEFADPDAMENLNRMQREIEDYLREAARNQGLERSREGFKLTPKTLRLFQRNLLTEIFSDLAAARSGRHTGPIQGEGATELERTRPYEFGDSAANMDTVGTLLSAAARGGVTGARVRVTGDDINVHLTRNNPKCATMVLMDMSGSMRYGGQYIHCKRMALALDGLIRTEYPGDFLNFIEMATFARLQNIGDLPALLPKPVTIHRPVVRLRADMSDPRLSEMQVPQHFTNIQHALSLSRRVLANQPTPNRQIILITDGLPTAHFEGHELFMLYPPDPRTEEATMREAALCARDGVTINIFLIPSWSQASEDIQFAHRLARSTRGRVFFTAGKDLDRFVLWDYVKQRRSIIS
ncbi:MAG: hypothetical protein JSR77_06620 [Planctomycetes bacterium]|nr:hypothetical protein [Planctomycetota bacterium]